MRKRIFIGIKASKNLQKEILKWRKRYLKTLSVRWIPRENLHITLIPPWNEEDIEKATQVLESIRGSFSPFEVEFIKVSFGPSFKRPRLIWAKGKESPGMVYLKKTLERTLGKRGERRPFRPHLTLARFKTNDFCEFKIKKLQDKVSWIEKIETVCLYESKTLPSGAKYKILERVEFE